MAYSYQVKVTDNVSAPMAALIAGLRNRRPLNMAIGQRVKTLIREHAVENERRKTDTTSRLGARRSGFWSAAAESVARTTPEAGQDRVSISLNHPGWPRAFGDVTIAPKSGLYLTIPLVAAAYNKRAYRVKGLFFLRSKKGNAFLARRTGAKQIELYYRLVNSVRQQRDPSLFPTDEQITTSAIAGARDYVEFLLAQKQKEGPRA